MTCNEGMLFETCRLLMRTRVVISGLLSLFSGCRPMAAQSQAFPAWVVSGLQRVGQNDAPGSQGFASLLAGRQEYADFQVVIQAPAGGLTGVNVVASALTSTDGEHIIPSSNVILYREVYVYVDEASPDRGGPNFSQGAGWYPDPLVPFVDPHTGNPPNGGNYVSSPFSVSAGMDQPVWVDVFVPADAAAGVYTGVLEVTSNQGTVSIPVTLSVWGFSLPLSPSMKSVFIYWTQFNTSMIEDLLQNKVMPQDAGTNEGSIQYLIQNFGLNTTTTGFWSGAQEGTAL